MTASRDSDLAAQLVAGSAELGLPLPESQCEQLLTYLALLHKWNRVYNLTAIRQRAKWVSHHILDSLAVVRHLPPGAMVDIGTGAGLPGIPVAIAQPERSVVLLDSNHKKGAFLQQAAIECGLRNCSVHVGRAEDWRPATRFEGAISRAFTDLTGFAEAARGLVRPGGWLAAMKGVHPDEELALLPSWVEVDRVIPLEVPGMRAARHLILMNLRGTG
ncbi:MAG: 16S rRNA (guanine(527)-N(7))-methyltransferase RsmG [Burkholderiales bacterium]|nr:16S rRNA (guanine(527)-N(7))-methyltransferase RsmG [Burkholderiales bacterium]